MNTATPQIESTPDWEQAYPPLMVKEPWFRSRRFIIFIITLLLSAFISLSYVFSRPAIYLSYATLLTVAKTAVDQRSKEADIQHVAIQKQILLGYELIAETAKRLKLLEESHIKLTVADIRQMLTVEPVAETNLVKMTAESSDPVILPVLINTWIDVYLDARADTVKQATGSTTDTLQEELDNLSKKIDLTRSEIKQFREENDISSTGREENNVLARLKGLNNSLNKAREKELAAKARMETVKNALSQGKVLVPEGDKQRLSSLEQRAHTLRAQLKKLDQRYTRDYMAKIAKLKVIPERLEALEKRIVEMRQKGQKDVLINAQQKYAIATQTVRSLTQELWGHKKLATEFTAKFAEYTALQSDLEAMELLGRETQQRLIKIEAKQLEKYPQVDIVERAFLPRDPIRPNFFRDALIAVIGSLLLSLLAVWIADFLTLKDEPNAAINLSGIHLYNSGIQQAALADTNPPQTLAQQETYALENSFAREISLQELDVLMRAASDKAKLLIALLLSGLSLAEISILDLDVDVDVDIDGNVLRIKGASPRSITISPGLRKLLSANNNCISGESVTTEDIAAILLCTVVDAGLAGPGEIKAEAIRLSYIIYLVEQGIRLSDLELIFGHISPTELSEYSKYSPAGPGRSFKRINLVHPALARIDVLLED